MNEDVWQILQIMMWITGGQLTIVLAVVGFIWNNLGKKMDKIDARIDKLCEKVENIDKRLCRIEGGLSTYGHCLLNHSAQDKKAE